MCDLRKNIWKTLKMTKITVGLTLRLIFVPNQVMKFVLMGPIALRGAYNVSLGDIMCS